MDLFDEILEFVLALPTLVREVERNTHNPNIAVLETLSRRLEDSVDLLLIIDSHLSASSVGSDLMENIRRLRLLVEQSLEACEAATSRNTMETSMCSHVLTVSSRTTPGRPSLCLPRDTLDFCQSMGLPWSEVARRFGISTRTLLRRRHEYGLASGRSTFDEISDDELDQIVSSCLETTPNAGETLIRGSIADRGLHVQRDRIRASLRRVDPVSRSLRRTRTILRREYRVAGPNALWYV